MNTKLPLICLTILLVFLANSALAAPPELPRTYVDSRFPSLGNAAVRNVKAGDDLQAALDAVLPGEILELEAGATFTGTFVLRKKSGSAWIIIRTSAHSSLPAEGNRVSPPNKNLMPKIVSPDSLPAITAEFGAHNYRFVGLEITTTASINYNLVLLGYAAKNTVLRASVESDLPSHIIFDRVYIHGSPAQTVRRGIMMEAKHFALIDSYISDIHEVGQDSQAVASFNGAGPFKIINNYLEGAGENLIFGGVDPQIPNLVPADIVVQKNYFYKPFSWKQGHPDYAGTLWSVKNNFELKNARRALISNNIFENCWSQAQDGTAILFTVRNQNGTAPWSTVEDVTFENNYLTNAVSGFLLLGNDKVSGTTSQNMKRLKISNNLVDKITRDFVAFSTFDTPMVDVEFRSNTLIHSGEGNSIFMVNSISVPFVAQNTTVVDNIISHGTYGIVGSGTATGKASLDKFFSGYLMTNNVLFGNVRNSPANYPSGNFHPQTIDEVGFAGPASNNYTLNANSAFKGKSSAPGVDPGANTVKLFQDLACVKSGQCADGKLDTLSPSSPSNLRSQ